MNLFKHNYLTFKLITLHKSSVTKKLKQIEGLLMNERKILEETKEKILDELEEISKFHASLAQMVHSLSSSAHRVNFPHIDDDEVKDRIQKVNEIQDRARVIYELIHGVMMVTHLIYI